MTKRAAAAAELVETKQADAPVRLCPCAICQANGSGDVKPIEDPLLYELRHDPTSRFAGVPFDITRYVISPYIHPMAQADGNLPKTVEVRHVKWVCVGCARYYDGRTHACVRGHPWIPWWQRTKLPLF